MRQLICRHLRPRAAGNEELGLRVPRLPSAVRRQLSGHQTSTEIPLAIDGESTSLASRLCGRVNGASVTEMKPGCVAGIVFGRYAIREADDQRVMPGGSSLVPGSWGGPGRCWTSVVPLAGDPGFDLTSQQIEGDVRDAEVDHCPVSLEHPRLATRSCAHVRRPATDIRPARGSFPVCASQHRSRPLRVWA